MCPYSKRQRFEQKKNPLGVFTIIYNLNLNPSEIGWRYKSREEREQVFGTMKGDLESDKTRLRDCEKVNGFFFLIFLALRIRFKILKVLKDHNLLGNTSLNEIIFELLNMEGIIEISGVEFFCSSSKKV